MNNTATRNKEATYQSIGHEEAPTQTSTTRIPTQHPPRRAMNSLGSASPLGILQWDIEMLENISQWLFTSIET